MAEENNATAPVEAPVEAPKSETASTNQEPAQAPAEAKTEQNANTITLTDEQKKFFESNGGLEKVFEKYKSAVANPEPKQVSEKPAEEPKKEESKPAEQPAQPKPVKGSITPGEFLTQQYFNALASEDKYKDISKDITSGDVLKEMAGFNISPVNQDGSINDALVRRFLDMKAKTVPPKAPAGETASTTPTVDYINVGDKVATREDAMKVLSQKGHPQYEEALKVVRGEIFGSNKPLEKK